MAFCYFSREFTAGSYTGVENKFITKYMPQADDFAVKVYLYGLYLCQNPARDFSVENCAEVLKIPVEKIIEAFEFWEDCDLVQILCRDPFTLEYLPVTSTEGRPKKIRYEKYVDFNKELQRKMQTVGIFLDYPILQKYMNFLQNNEMEQQAFLLIVEYCIRQSGAAVSHAQIFNKAKNFVGRGLFTYTQVEKALSDFNVHTADIRRVIAALGAYKREPNETDYALFEKWMEAGFNPAAVYEAAKSMKRGNMQSLDALMDELKEKEKFTANEIAGYIAERDALCNLTFKVAKNLGVKIGSPLVYNDEYVRKWIDMGFDDETTLCSLALFCTKTERNSFARLNELIEQLHDEKYSAETVQEYLKEKQKDLKLLGKIQLYCGAVRMTEANLNMIAVWRKWKFKDDMILEAARRAADSVHPLAYMNKVLSAWAREDVFTVAAIPQKKETIERPPYAAAASAADERAERERFYAARRAKAELAAEKNEQRAMENKEYGKLSSELSEAERQAARAEAFGQDNLAELLRGVEELKRKKRTVLSDMGMTESDLLPQYICKKCSDSGFLPDGRACDCYAKAEKQAK